MTELLVDYGFPSTRPAKGETLRAGSFARWYLDLFIDAALKVGEKHIKSLFLSSDWRHTGQRLCVHHVAHSHAARPANRHVRPEHVVESHEQRRAVEAVPHRPLNGELEQR